MPRVLSVVAVMEAKIIANGDTGVQHVCVCRHAYCISSLTHHMTNNILTPTEAENDYLCKVCMDSAVDCVFLDCGHMLTCVKCGRKLSECPICRQYIVKVIHAFRV